ncbi:MAG TPA: hypothetical protein DD405_03480 [Desulfobacteraceae bacterium]|nr:hypothetical protein [Desulfobacteraceae bacterium]
MPIKKNKKSFFVKAGLIFACIILLVVAGLWIALKDKHAGTESPEVKTIAVKKQHVIDYNKIGKDTALKEMMEQRKADYGIENGVDVIVQSDEAVKIGDVTVPMQRIIEKIRLKSGEIVESDIGPSKKNRNYKNETFGIYIVKKGDSIWNIHFNFLKGYFVHKGIPLAATSDEPDRFGFSSGVGKILKFSENLVSIYNIKENRLDMDLDLIHPLNKLIIYNMTQIFGLLDSIDYKNVNSIQFDGEVLWIPSG